MRKGILLFCLGLLSMTSLARAGDAYLELLKSDVRAMKRAIIEDVMDFGEEEAAKFWPIYDRYEHRLRKINQARLALIRDYAESWGSMSDSKAKQLAKRAIDLRFKRDYLMKEYFRKLDYALPTRTAAKFLQLENQIGLLIDLQIAAELPLIK